MADAAYDEQKKKPRSTKEVIKEFCSYTTTHGVGRLAGTKTRFSRFIWIAFVLGAFAMFFYQAHGLFTLYFSRPVSTVVNIKQATVSTAWHYLKTKIRA